MPSRVETIWYGHVSCIFDFALYIIISSVSSTGDVKLHICHVKNAVRPNMAQKICEIFVVTDS